MSRQQDLLAIMRGVQMVASESIKVHQSYLRHLWSNSSIKDLYDVNMKSTQTRANDVLKNPGKELDSLSKFVKEGIERTSVVAQGLRHYKTPTNISDESKINTKSHKNHARVTDIGNIDISTITLNELENLISTHNKNRSTKREIVIPKSSANATSSTNLVKESSKPSGNSNTVSEYKPADSMAHDESKVKNFMNLVSSYDRPVSAKTSIELPELSNVAKQRSVPSTRIGRMVSFGGLFAGLGVGTVNELAKGALGLGGSTTVKEAFLSPNNTERIVDTLCKVRGAALKLGQILSIQDSSIVSPQLIKAFDRVRQAADYMPDWQVEQVMQSEFGKEWRNKLIKFDDKPFAAASIGQVHRGVLLDGTEVAIKIQYPGVAKSIESDIDNLVAMLKVWDVFPPGIFIDSVVKVAKRELAWEVDYIREAEFTQNFADLIKNYKEYKVPQVIKDFSTKNVLTTELLPGVAMDLCFNASEAERNFIAECVMKLVLLELFAFRCMQTDPNWSNFLYDSESKRLMLIDFGATRFYSKEFIDNYLKVKFNLENCFGLHFLLLIFFNFL